MQDNEAANHGHGPAPDQQNLLKLCLNKMVLSHTSHPARQHGSSTTVERLLGARQKKLKIKRNPPRRRTEKANLTVQDNNRISSHSYKLVDQPV